MIALLLLWQLLAVIAWPVAVFVIFDDWLVQLALILFVPPLFRLQKA